MAEALSNFPKVIELRRLQTAPLHALWSKRLTLIKTRGVRFVVSRLRFDCVLLLKNQNILALVRKTLFHQLSNRKVWDYSVELINDIGMYCHRLNFYPA